MIVFAASEAEKGQETQEDMEIYGNGLNDIYIDIMGEPYTTYAEKDYGEYAYGSEGCAWFASARACEMTGIDTHVWDGQNWYEKAYAYYQYTRGQELREKALACYGWHVLVVEKIDGEEITVSEGGYSPDGNKNGYTWIHTITKEELESETKYGGFIGYVYLFEDTKPYEPETKPEDDSTSGWRQDASGWWYRYADGTYPASKWENIDDQWYYFDGKGYMTVNTWTPDGYYVGTDGVWIKDYQEQGSWRSDASGWWYRYVDGTYPVSKWENLDDKWYYFDGNGYMATGWSAVNGYWYYLNESGAMATGWKAVNGYWYYLNESGAMAVGWKVVNGSWYYLTESGAMAGNTWVGNYYVGSNGAMYMNAWTPDGYYVGENGAWVPDR